MRRAAHIRRFFRTSAFTLILLALVTFARAHAANTPLDTAFEAFWAARNPVEAAAASGGVAKSGAPFDEVYAHLKAGRPYGANAPSGERALTRKNAAGVNFPYMVVVPAGYDSKKTYPVRVYLHGGIGRPAVRPGACLPTYQNFIKPDEIEVFPCGWEATMWWQSSQVENISAIIDELKRTYNVDENRMFLAGISDGATGVYYHALRASTMWAGFLPFNGHPAVLSNPRMGAEGELFVSNLTNKPILAFNGESDPLYPASRVFPWLRMFNQAGVKIAFRPQDAAHNLSWYDKELPTIDKFVQASPRQPLPDRLSWQTERTDTANRDHWLVISELASVKGESTFEEFNTVTPLEQGLSLGIDAEQTDTGVRVTEIETDSIAAVAGFRVGDMILSLNDVKTTNLQELIQALQGVHHGAKYPVSIERDGKPLTLQLEIAADPASRPFEAFRHTQPSGRVDVERTGNSIVVKTHGVKRYTLLVSPDQFDLKQPITVTTNGVSSFSGKVTPDVGTLLRWAAQDNDRTMLFAAEIEITVQPSAPE